MAEVSAFTEGDLRELAGERSFERGQGYRHAVTGIEITASGVTATVHGGDAYEVTLTVDADEGLSGECECPFGQDGNFCKHCVALGLVVLGRNLELVSGRRSPGSRTTWTRWSQRSQRTPPREGRRICRSPWNSTSAEALEWAERGLRETARHPLGADPLGDHVAERYERAGRLTDVVAIRRKRFEASLSLNGYGDLRDAARKAGCWDTERPAALGLLRAEAPGRPRHEPILVDALVDDGDGDAAWQAAQGRASDRQRLAVADLVRDDRPADALSVYLRAIESRTHLTGDDDHRKIASLLLSARDCHHRLGTDGDFTAYVNRLRATQRRKRNLAKILGQRGL